MIKNQKVIDLLINNSKFGLTKENFEIVQVASSEGSLKIK